LPKQGHDAQNFDTIRKTVIAGKRTTVENRHEKKKAQSFAESKIQRNPTQNLNAFALQLSPINNPELTLAT
jgi:uncharacterized protein (DUF1684 family)